MLSPLDGQPTESDGGDYCMGPVRCPELVHYGGEAIFHRGLTYIQVSGDELIGIPFSHQCQDFHLTLCQRVGIGRGGSSISRTDYKGSVNAQYAQ